MSKRDFEGLAEILANNPEFASLWSKARAVPEGPRPDPEPCSTCGEPVQYMASLGAWRKGYCASCHARKLAMDDEQARRHVVAERVRRNLGAQLGERIDERYPLDRRIRRWLEGGMHERPWLYLHGQPDAGKTTQAIQLTWAIHEQDVAKVPPVAEDYGLTEIDQRAPYRSVVYTTEPSMVRSTWPSATDRRSIEYWASLPVLIVDEVGRRASASDHTADVLFAIYDARQEARRTTVLISNFSPQTLRNRSIWGQDEPLMQRLIARSQVVEMTWQGWRSS